MSVADIRSGVVTILEAAGAHNVTAEETVSVGDAETVTARTYGDRMHYWIVRSTRLPGQGGAGYLDARHRVTVEGFIGCARDNPADGTTSDLTVTALWDAIVSAIELAANSTPGSAIDRDELNVDPISKPTFIQFGTEKVLAHTLRLTATYLEA